MAPSVDYTVYVTEVKMQFYHIVRCKKKKERSLSIFGNFTVQRHLYGLILKNKVNGMKCNSKAEQTSPIDTKEFK